MHWLLQVKMDPRLRGDDGSLADAVRAWTKALLGAASPAATQLKQTRMALFTENNAT